MAINKKKNKRVIHFLFGSFALLILVSIIAFLCLGFYIGRVSRKSIHQVGDLYMEGINEQMTAHFQTLIGLKLQQAQTVVKSVPSDVYEMQKLYEELIYRAEARNFDHLALCSEDEEIEMLYGEKIQLADPEPFYESLRHGERKVAVGSDEAGNEVVIFGVSAHYPMYNGKTSMAMLTALPIEYISSMLGTQDSDSLIYSFIIRKDGTFIASDLSEEYQDYFDSLYGRHDESNRKTIDIYIDELSLAMEEGRSYSTILNLGGNREQIYCNALPYSEWYLVTVLPFGDLNVAVETLGIKRTVAMALIFAIILVTLIVIFYFYFRMSRQQMKDLEAARQEAMQANKAKSEFLSNMSHDIRTPMNAIVGMTAIATAHIDDKEQVKNCLKKITLSGQHLLGLINDILDMSKIESGKMTLTPEKVSLREVIEGVVSIVQPQAKGKEQDFNVHIGTVLTEDVYCDSVRLNQVLLNLLSNSVKYTQDGGSIELSLYQDETPPEKGSDFVRTHVFVKDNGMGMTPEFLEHIFDSYSRADNKRVHRTEGAGLGMAITKHIVDAMEGSIDVKSEPQKGTEFHLVLDFKKVVIEESDMILPSRKMHMEMEGTQENIQAEHDFSGHRVLVAEDNEINWEILKELLSDFGMELEWAENGKTCVEKFEKSETGYYELIFMDVRMPVMNGYEATTEIRNMSRADAKDIPIIAMTADAFSEDIKRCLDSGMNAHTAKPINIDEVILLLEKYML